MADTKITNLTSGDPALTGDEIPINRVSGGPLDRKVTAGTIASLAAGRLTNVQVFTTINTTLTYNPTAGISFVVVEAVGGGGAGAGCAALSTGCGGGAGGWGIRKISAATIGASQTVLVGSGGAAGVTGAIGAAGGSTSFGTLLLACGGGAGPIGTGANPRGGTGGVSLSGDVNIEGGDGDVGARFPTTGGVVIGGKGGFGGASRYGGGGSSASLGPVTGGAPQAGNIGNAYGSGGGGGVGGGASGAVGGAGSPGIVIVWEYL